MERINVACKKCSGFGYTRQNFVASDDGVTLKMERDTCEECNGLGYIEHVIFSVEEANAILKHCGLTTEEEMNTSNCSGCVYEDSDGSTTAVSNCVCCSRNVHFAKNDNYRKK